MAADILSRVVALQRRVMEVRALILSLGGHDPARGLPWRMREPREPLPPPATGSRFHEPADSRLSLFCGLGAMPDCLGEQVAVWAPDSPVRDGLEI